ncbi:NAD(P)H-binding protein [Chryseobacterium sp.]|uniref:NAD(P)H-binding protein n=1 Tax=Chryseobacterium sp. TaxID=1871047 RepID=UPI0024E2387C|nr:NAD(P)H-binding protein [Chryseobacterium sp.]
MNIMILGFSQEIEILLTTELIARTPHNLTLYTEADHHQLERMGKGKLKVLKGEVIDKEAIYKAMNGIDIVYVNRGNDDYSLDIIIESLYECGVKRIIAVSILEISSKTPIGLKGNQIMSGHAKFAEGIRDLRKDYTLVCLSKLSTQENAYLLTHERTPFRGVEMTTKMIIQFLVNIVSMAFERESFIKKSLQDKT